MSNPLNPSGQTMWAVDPSYGNTVLRADPGHTHDVAAWDNIRTRTTSAPPNKMFTIAAGKHGGFYIFEGPGISSMVSEIAFACSTMEEATEWVRNKWLLAPEA